MARRGNVEEAARLAQEAIELAPPRDAPLARGDTLMDAAEVLALVRRNNQAAPVAEEALRLYQQKGNLVMAGRARALLVELGALHAN